MDKVNRKELDPVFLANLEADITQNVISREAVVHSSTRHINIPLKNYINEYHQFMLFKNGVLYNQNKYIIEESSILINETEPEVTVNDKIEFVFMYNQSKRQNHVDNSEINGEDIISHTVTANKLDTVTSTKINSISNPNMLYNGDFSIWQRGESIVGNQRNYGADRWLIWTTKSPVFSKIDNGARILCTGNDNIVQALDGYQGKHFDALTVSIKYKSKRPNCRITILLEDTATVGTVTLNSLFARMVSVANGDSEYQTASITAYDVNVKDLLGVRCYLPDEISIGNEVDIEYIKLEEGSVATPHIRPNPFDELQRCKAFYETGESIMCYTKDSNIWSITAGNFLVEKRAIPTIKMYSDFDNTENVCSNIYSNENTNESVTGINVNNQGISSVTLSPSVERNAITVKWTADAELY